MPLPLFAPRAKQRAPGVVVPVFDQGRVTHEHQRAGLVEMRDRRLRARALGGRDADDVEAVETKALEQRQLLQHHRALAPRRLADSVAAVIIRQRSLDAGLPLRHVLPGEHALVRRATHVHHRLRSAEFVDRRGDKALRPNLTRLLDLRDAIGARAVGYDELPAGADIVVVCTPPQRHADQAVRLLDAGAAVVLEKPLCRTIDEADRPALAKLLEPAAVPDEPPPAARPIVQIWTLEALLPLVATAAQPGVHPANRGGRG